MSEQWQYQQDQAEEWLANQFEEAVQESSWPESNAQDIDQAVVAVVNMIPPLLKAIMSGTHFDCFVAPTVRAVTECWRTSVLTERTSS